MGAEGKGFGLAMKCLDRSRGVNSYGALGIAQRALDEAVAYAKQRKTFGRPIIGHQGVQFLLADMEIDVTTARALLWQCAQMVDKGCIRHKAGLRDQDLPERNGHAGHHQCRTSAGRVWLQP